MITFTELGNHGRLGNQLFQYAFLIGISKKYNLPIFLPNLSTKIANNQQCLLNNFNLDYSHLNDNLITNYRHEIELKNNGIFDTYNPQNTENVLPGTNFMGLYQSYKYWIEYQDEVKKQFTIKDSKIIEDAKQTIDKLRTTIKLPIIAIHLRRGDVTGWYDYTQYKQYLKDVLKSFKNPKNNFYYIFTGGSPSITGDQDDVKWVKDFYKELPYFEVCQTYNPIVDFALMQECNQIILGYISTFAWWAAFLSNKPVYAPKLFNKGEDVRLNYYPNNFNLF
jgi:hypothetical protein